MRFNLVQLLKATALVALVSSFARTEGCGRRSVMVESLSFSPDGNRILVSKLAARDANPWRESSFKADVSRTLSWIEVRNGRASRPFQQDHQPGACGQARRFYAKGRQSAACNPADDTIAWTTFGGGKIVTIYDGKSVRKLPLQLPANHLVFSPSGRYLAASGIDSISVLDLERNEVTFIRTESDAAIGASLMAFSHDEASLYASDSYNLDVWNVETGAKLGEVAIEPQSRKRVWDLASTADGSLIVCVWGLVQQYANGNLVEIFATHGAKSSCEISRNGQTLAIYDFDNWRAASNELRSYDAPTNELLHSRKYVDPYPSTVALAPDGKTMAIGDDSGRVTLVDVVTGSQLWTSYPPDMLYVAWPWTAPAALLLIWGWIEWQRLAKRPIQAAVQPAQPAQSAPPA